MKYQVKKGTQTYENLVELQARLNSCLDAMKPIFNEFGAVQYIPLKSNDIAFGGFSALIFKKASPPHWGKVPGVKNAWYPKNWAVNRPLIDRIGKLPVVTLNEYNDAIGVTYEPAMAHNRYGFTHIESEELFLIECSSIDVSPDLEEILESRFLALKKLS